MLSAVNETLDALFSIGGACAMAVTLTLTIVGKPSAAFVSMAVCLLFAILDNVVLRRRK